MKNTYTKLAKSFQTLTVVGLFLGFSLFPLPQANAQVVPALVSINVSPSTICSGQSAHLSWASTDATVTISPGIGSVNPYGERDVFPTQTTTYTITGTNTTGGYGTAYAIVTVTGSCQQPPTVEISADNTNINYGGNTTVRWSQQICQLVVLVLLVVVQMVGLEVKILQVLSTLEL